MNEIYLIITLTMATWSDSNIITIPVDTLQECNDRGVIAVKKLTKTRQVKTLMGMPSTTVDRKATYECVEL